jgi:hypothetical protein
VSSCVREKEKEEASTSYEFLQQQKIARLMVAAKPGFSSIEKARAVFALNIEEG